MKQAKIIPQLRFSGFDDEWEEKKLGEISSKVSKKNTDNSITETFTNSAEFGIISQRDFFDHDISNEENIDGYFIVENDDFVYNPRISTIAPVGPINRNKLGRSGVMSPLYYVFRTHDIDKSFLEKYFKSECWYDFMFLNGNSGARSDRFSITDSVFTQMPIRVPRIKLEQQKIGTFLSHVDSLIQAKTKKLESLKAVKKSLLQKCFPKAGEKVPEMRFAGFSGEWEESSATKLFETVSDKGHPELPVLSASQELGMIYRDDFKSDIQYNTQNTFGYKRVCPKQFVIHLRSFQGGFAHSKIEGITSPAYTILKLRDENNHDDIFWKYVLTSESFIKTLETIIYGIRDGKSISFDDFSTLVFIYPSSKNEQQKIGQFFSKYDSLISAQQKEIDKLKDIKKSILQKMFI